MMLLLPLLPQMTAQTIAYHTLCWPRCLASQGAEWDAGGRADYFSDRYGGLFTEDYGGNNKLARETTVNPISV